VVNGYGQKCGAIGQDMMRWLWSDGRVSVGPTNRLIVGKLLKDKRPTCDLKFTAAEVDASFAK
jgi:hypothetical protein